MKTVPQKPSWYESFLRASEERFLRESAEANIKMNREFCQPSMSHEIIRYTDEATGRFIVGIDTSKNVMSASAFAIISLHRMEQHETLEVLGYDDPYRQ